MSFEINDSWIRGYMVPAGPLPKAPLKVPSVNPVTEVPPEVMPLKVPLSGTPRVMPNTPITGTTVEPVGGMGWAIAAELLAMVVVAGGVYALNRWANAPKSPATPEELERQRLILEGERLRYQFNETEPPPWLRDAFVHLEMAMATMDHLAPITGRADVRPRIVNSGSGASAEKFNSEDLAVRGPGVPRDIYGAPEALVRPGGDGALKVDAKMSDGRVGERPVFATIRKLMAAEKLGLLIDPGSIDREARHLEYVILHWDRISPEVRKVIALRPNHKPNLRQWETLIRAGVNAHQFPPMIGYGRQAPMKDNIQLIILWGERLLRGAVPDDAIEKLESVSGRKLTGVGGALRRDDLKRPLMDGVMEKLGELRNPSALERLELFKQVAESIDRMILLPSGSRAPLLPKGMVEEMRGLVSMAVAAEREIYSAGAATRETKAAARLATARILHVYARLLNQPGSVELSSLYMDAALRRYDSLGDYEKAAVIKKEMRHLPAPMSVDDVVDEMKVRLRHQVAIGGDSLAWITAEIESFGRLGLAHLSHQGFRRCSQILREMGHAGMARQLLTLSDEWGQFANWAGMLRRGESPHFVGGN